MLHSGFVLFFWEVTAMQLLEWNCGMCQPTRLAPKSMAISSSTYVFEFISGLGVVQSLLNRNDGEHHPQEIFQRPNGKCQMFDSEIEPAQLLTASMVCSRFFQASVSPTVSSFSPIGKFQLGMGPKTIPFRTSFWAFFVAKCLLMWMYQMLGHIKKMQKTPNKNQPQK